MKLAIVVQRYGADILGGAELHARYIAERLARHLEVEVLTTCARDYVTWRNELPPGLEREGGLAVRRFQVDRERSAEDFGRRSARVFERHHSVADELAWVDSEGPTSRTLIRFIRSHADAYDFFAFFSYRYYHTYHGVQAVPGRALLVPTAERDPAIGLSIFGPVFRGARGIMYNSFEERAMIREVSGNQQVPGIVVGVGSEVPDRVDPQRFRTKYGITDPFVIYVGRIDENKGCRELFEFFQHYARRPDTKLVLVLIGTSLLPIPSHPRVRYLGYLDDRDKFDAIAASDVLVMPSYLESLSMVALEAWGLGRPVLANARCDVLKGQCLRSNAGLYYDDDEEFAETLDSLVRSQGLRAALGQNGRRYFDRHYAWPVIEGKYLDMLQRLQREPVPEAALDPLPGWFARRRRTLPPARSVMESLAAGPVSAGAAAAS